MLHPCGTLATFVWQPLMTPAQIAFLLVPLASLAVWSCWRQLAGHVTGYAAQPGKARWNRHVAASVSLLLMRLIALAALGLILLGPSDLPDGDLDDQPMSVTVLLDLSESMETDDCRQLPRWQYARDHWLRSPALARIASNGYVETYGFAEELFPLASNSLQQRTVPASAGLLSYIGRCAREAIQQQAMQRDGAILLLSDGHDSEELEINAIAPLARARRVPVYTVPLGGATNQHDIAVIAVPMQESMLPGEPGAILVKVRQVGMGTSRTTVRLRGSGEEQSQVVEFNGRDVVEVRFDVQREARGQYEYEVVADALPEEH
ncbi:MAG: VWA domain-containing protein, partial [Planctomycetales bacterium]|nr:VWA domain-containing protein [Planctomycetales bacterium]